MPQIINVADFTLASTLECGQAFRWQRAADGWFVGVVGHRVVRLRQRPSGIEWDAYPSGDALFIERYLALDVALPKIIATFPCDAVLRKAVNDHSGLRVLRQESWECLASFIASSTKQIVQIRQIVAELARRFGDPIETPHGVFHTFPSVAVISRASHQQLWDCKLGFRAKNLLAAAQRIDSGEIKLEELRAMDFERALEELTKLHGVGEKIASCALLFSLGHDEAFPIDVWVERALRRLYFAGKNKVTSRQLREFARNHFGPYAGWAQQYLFFSERTRGRQALLDTVTE